MGASLMAQTLKNLSIHRSQLIFGFLLWMTTFAFWLTSLMSLISKSPSLRHKSSLDVDTESGVSVYKEEDCWHSKGVWPVSGNNCPSPGDNWGFELLPQMARLPHLPFLAQEVAPKLECEPLKARVRLQSLCLQPLTHLSFNKCLPLKMT